MSPSWHLDDELVEAIVSGEPVDDAPAPLVAFARSVRVVGERTVPRPSDELVELLQGIRPTGPRPVVAPPATSPATTGRSRISMRRQRVPAGIAALVGKVASLGLLGKAGLGGAAVAVSGLAAGATGVAPAPVTDAVQGAITTATPFNLEDTEDTDATVNVGDTAGVGAEADADNGVGVGADADVDDVTGTATDAVGGVAGTATGVAGEAVGTATETVDGVADEALDIPNETPVGEIVPDELPELPVATTLPPVPGLPQLPDAEAGVGADANRP